MIRVSENNPYHNLDLESYSLYPGEREVLLLPHFYFEVMKTRKKGKYTFIELKEVAHQNILSLDKLELPRIAWVSETFSKKSKSKNKEDIHLLDLLQRKYGSAIVKSCNNIL